MFRMGHECPLSYNPADFYIRTLAIVPGTEEECRHRVAQICDAFRDSEERKAVEEVGLSDDEVTGATPDDLGEADRRPTRYKASWLTQFRAVVGRSWTANLREPVIIKIRIVQSLVSTFNVPYKYLKTGKQD